MRGVGFRDLRHCLPAQDTRDYLGEALRQPFVKSLFGPRMGIGVKDRASSTYQR
jgi:hypothetical protein